MADQTEKKNGPFPYIHGFSPEEQARLRQQARLFEVQIFQSLDFSRVRHLLEVGCGVGAQTEIFLRRFPDLKLTGIDQSETQLEAAGRHLQELSFAKGRYQLKKEEATKMSFANGQFDGAYISWVLEHVPTPLDVLNEVKRVLQPDAYLVINEAMNFSFFLDPYSPHLWKYWMAFNDYQWEKAGDPFVGAKLGNLLLKAGYSDIRTEVKVMHLDNRQPERRREYLKFWEELLFSAEPELLRNGFVDTSLCKEMRRELAEVGRNPDAIFFDAYMQAQART